MAEASTALCFSSSFSRANHPSLSRAFPRDFPISQPCPCRLLRFPTKSSADSAPDDLFGFFPWSNDSAEIQWVAEDRVTLFTSEGLVQIRGSIVPRRVASSNGLDMGRKLCIFGFCRSIEMLSDVVEDTVLKHGGEMTSFFPQLFYYVIVLLPKKVVEAEKVTKGGLHEKLRMTVAVPLLWGFLLLLKPFTSLLRVVGEL